MNSSHKSERTKVATLTKEENIYRADMILKAVREFEKRKERQYTRGILDQQVKTLN